MDYAREELEGVLDQFVKYGSSFVRVNLAKMGYGLDVFTNHWDKDVRVAVANQGYGLERLVVDDCPDVRVAVAKQGYGLDILLTDSDWRVRAEVAKHGYGLDRLVHDWHSGVRIEVAKQQYGLDILVNDDVWSVRETVAWQGYGLDKLMFDSVYSVRAAVAGQGYGLDVLANDASEEVRNAALFFLRKQELDRREREWAEQGYVYHQRKIAEKDAEARNSSRDGEVGKNRPVAKEFSNDELLGILKQVLSLADFDTKCRVIEAGYGLDFFVDDFYDSVREAAREKLEQEIGSGFDCMLADATQRSCLSEGGAYAGVRNLELGTLEGITSR